jgi:uncharacterized protein YfiM (DUF2279 family)
MNELARAVLVALGMLAPEPSQTGTSPSWLRVGTGPAAAAPAVTREPAGPPADAWLGEDKFRHFWASYVVTSFGFAAAVAAEQDRDTALLVGIGAGAAAGIAKELYDRRRGQIFSRRDLVADALGIAAAYFLLREIR